MPQATPSHRPNKRQAILDAALTLYADGGFRGTGLTAIGARAGVSHAAVLYHFGSAAELLLAVLEERDRIFARRYAEVFRGPPLEQIARIPEVARFNLENPGLARLHTVLAAESLDPKSPAHDWFRKRSRALHASWVRLLEAGIASGELRPDLDAGKEANALIAFMEGAQQQHFLDPARVDLVGLYEAYSEAMVRHLRA